MCAAVPTTNRPRVLVVDDDRLVADTLTQVLNISGFDATADYSGERAVELAGMHHFDLFVSDVVMDGMTGIEAALSVCKLLPGCRVLLLSGNDETDRLLDEARVRGHDFDILAKPAHPLLIIEKLQIANSAGIEDAN